MKLTTKITIGACFPLTASIAVPIGLIASGENLSEVHVLSINDFHGAAPGFGDTNFNVNYQNAGAIRLAQETQEIISAHPGSIFISAGDLNGGESFSVVTKGKTLYPVLKAMDIKFSAVGNHAWDWGWTEEDFKVYSQLAKPDDVVGNYFLNSNVLFTPSLREKKWCIDVNNSNFIDDFNLWRSSRISWADPYKIVNMNGHNVCFIGLTTYDTVKDSNTRVTSNYSFIDYNASIVYSKYLLHQNLVDEGKEKEYNEIEAFILDAHCACQPSNNKEKVEGDTADLARNLTTKVDAIISAHSHRVVTGVVNNSNFHNNVYIGQAGQSGRYFLDTKIVFDDNKPKGHRLRTISMDVKKPYIYTNGIDVSKALPVQKEVARSLAHTQIQNIIATTKYDVVKNTAEVYDDETFNALEELSSVIGKTTQKVIPYYYTDNLTRSNGHEYMQSPNLLEKMGMWHCRGQLNQFNQQYGEAKTNYKASFSMCTVDQLKTSWTKSNHQISKSDIFDLISFENYVSSGSITVDQLKQYINYALEGACKFNYSSKSKCNMDFYYDDAHTNKISWLPNEKVNNDTEIGTSFVSGPIQFYGIKFNVTFKESRTDTDGTKFNVYKYADDDSLAIYDPYNSSNLLDDPSTWTNSTNWKGPDNSGLIVYTISDFTYNGGNAQNRMLRHWTDYNSKTYPLASSQVYAKTVRDFCIDYCNTMTKNSKTIDDALPESNALLTIK